MKGYICDWCKTPAEKLTPDQLQREAMPRGWSEIVVGTEGPGTNYEDVCKTCIASARKALKK